MKIDSDFIDKIFNLKIKIKKLDDKIKLSKYEEQIPMYDIYSQKIYAINKKNIHYRLIDYHYRFVNEEVYQWLKNLYDKYKKDKTLETKFKYNLDLMDNYDIPTLIETSYKVLYKYSPLLGLSVSICKRNSFHPFIYYLKPYYTKLELIKLGQNMNIVKEDIDPEYLIEQDTHYKICKTVSKNDVSFEEIKKHHEYIIANKLNSWICFYSFTGSFLFNKFLRNFQVMAIRGYQNQQMTLPPIFQNGLIDIVKTIENSPSLENDYDLYRFIWDDSFLINIKEGEIFIDKGFISTTRDPFYSPGLMGNFGLILLKIKIPKNKKGCGLFIENFSLFPKEEEFLLPPYTKLKLLSKNENFKYYHTNQEFEKLINRKYEFELIETDYKKFYEEHKKISSQLCTDIARAPRASRNKCSENNLFTQVEKITINGIDRISLIKEFIKLYSRNNEIYLKVGQNNFIIYYQWFDASSNSSYEKFYHNKTKDGMLFSIFDEYGYPYLNIEFGSDMAINYLNKFYHSANKINTIDDKIIDLIYHLGKIFSYKSCIIYHEHKSFDELYKDKDLKIFTNTNFYNHSIYDYLKNGKKFLGDNQFINYETGYWYLDEYFSKEVDIEIQNKLPENIREKNNKDQLIKIIENYFYYYPKIIENMDRNIFKKCYVIFNIYERLVSEGLEHFYRPNLDYSVEDKLDDNYTLVFRQPIRRF
jgi:hypothetical protein